MAKEDVKRLRRAGYSVRAAAKKIQYLHKEREVVRYKVTDRNTGESVTIQPDTVSAHRPYPVHVYLLAAAMCVLGGMTQRAAADAAGSAFGIPTFSASTVCRVLRALSEGAWLLLEAGRMSCGRADGDIVGCVRAAMGRSAERPPSGRCGLGDALLGFAEKCGLARGSPRAGPPGVAARASEAAGSLCRGFVSLAGGLPV